MNTCGILNLLQNHHISLASGRSTSFLVLCQRAGSLDKEQGGSAHVASYLYFELSSYLWYPVSGSLRLFAPLSEQFSSKRSLTLFMSCICIYARVYAYTRTNFFWQFLILSESVDATLLAPKRFTIFPGKLIKVGQFYSTFIRGDPYEPHRPIKKVTFSDHSLGWF